MSSHTSNQDRGPVKSPWAASHQCWLRSSAANSTLVGPPGTGGGNAGVASCPRWTSDCSSFTKAVYAPHAASKLGGFWSSFSVTVSNFASSDRTCPQLRLDALFWMEMFNQATRRCSAGSGWAVGPTSTVQLTLASPIRAAAVAATDTLGAVGDGCVG